MFFLQLNASLIMAFASLLFVSWSNYFPLKTRGPGCFLAFHLKCWLGGGGGGGESLFLRLATLTASLMRSNYATSFLRRHNCTFLCETFAPDHHSNLSTIVFRVTKWIRRRQWMKRRIFPIRPLETLAAIKLILGNNQEDSNEKKFYIIYPNIVPPIL